MLKHFHQEEVAPTQKIKLSPNAVIYRGERICDAFWSAEQTFDLSFLETKTTNIYIDSGCLSGRKDLRVPKW